MRTTSTHRRTTRAVLRTGIFSGIGLSILSLFLLIPAATAAEVRDPTGRRVTLPEHPARIVALAPSITEIVFALNRQDRLKGVTRFSTYPPEARDLPRVGSYVQLDIERIAALGPDLCIAVRDGNPKAVVDRLESLGVPVFAVDPRNLASVMESILAIGAILDADERARDIVAEMNARIGRIRELVVAAPERPGVFLQIDLSPIVSVGEETFIHELIETAGGRNLAAGPIPYPRFSREQVLALAPDIIIVTSMVRDGAFEKARAEWRRWPRLPAVQRDRIYLVDSDLLDRPGPRMTDALEALFRLIHPDLARVGDVSPPTGESDP